MQKTVRALIIVGVCVVGFSTAHAYTVGNKTIKTLHVNSNGGIYFETNEAMVNPDSCLHGGFYHVARASNYEKEIFAMLLTAKTSNTTVTFWLDGCEANYPKVTWFRSES